MLTVLHRTVEFVAWGKAWCMFGIGISAVFVKIGMLLFSEHTSSSVLFQNSENYCERMLSCSLSYRYSMKNVFIFPVIFTWAATVLHKTFTNSVLYFLSIALSDTAVPVKFFSNLTKWCLTMVHLIETTIWCNLLPFLSSTFPISSHILPRIEMQFNLKTTNLYYIKCIYKYLLKSLIICNLLLHQHIC